MYGDNIVFMYNVGIQKQANLVYVIKSSALIEVIRYFKYIYIILRRKRQSLKSTFPINKANSFISSKKKKIQTQF